MRKDSPIERFPGYVILPEFLTLPQVRAFESALGNLRDMTIELADQERVWLSVIAEQRVPVILQCVKEWHLKGIPKHPTVDTFPMTPIKAANDLVAWLFTELRDLWIGETDDSKN